MNERCLVLLDGFKKYNYDDNYILYTDDLSIEESLNAIISEDRFLVI